MKPWIKGTTYGKIYIDKSHPEFKKWFIEQIEKYSRLNPVHKKSDSLKVASR